MGVDGSMTTLFGGCFTSRAIEAIRESCSGVRFLSNSTPSSAMTFSTILSPAIFYLNLTRPAEPLPIAPLRRHRIRCFRQRAESPAPAGVAGVRPQRRQHTRLTMDHPNESTPGSPAPASLLRYCTGAGRFRVHVRARPATAAGFVLGRAPARY